MEMKLRPGTSVVGNTEPGDWAAPRQHSKTEGGSALAGRGAEGKIIEVESLSDDTCAASPLQMGVGAVGSEGKRVGSPIHHQLDKWSLHDASSAVAKDRPHAAPPSTVYV
eukprot:512154-Rhodomonas_salina.1